MATELNLVEEYFDAKQDNSQYGLRNYIYRDIAYPSVTTVLGKTADKSFLFKWIKKVGQEEANRIRDAAAERGQKTHELIENYFLHGKTEDYSYFNQFLTLAPRISNIRMLEYPIVNEKERYAGTIDMVASWDGIPSLIDMKTADKDKPRLYVQDYFLQTVAYAAAVNRSEYLVFDLDRLQQVVILIMQPTKTQVFIEKGDALPALWKEFMARRKGFQTLYGY